MGVPKHLTKSELAMLELRERMLRGELAPGERLRMKELVAMLDMSPTPIREALRRLQADGLVDFKAHHEIVVVERSPVDIEEIYELRTNLEPISVARAVGRLDESSLQRIEKLHAEFGKAVESGKGSVVALANRDWHEFFAQESGSSYLVEFIDKLWAGLPWRSMWTIPGRIGDEGGQHEAVMEAVRLGDADLAAERMLFHIEDGRRRLMGESSDSEGSE